MTITAGALEDLNDEELESGGSATSFGHIRGRDPWILFAVTSVMYMGVCTSGSPVLLELGQAASTLVLAFGVDLSVRKVPGGDRGQTRHSVAVLGKPSVLASLP